MAKTFKVKKSGGEGWKTFLFLLMIGTIVGMWQLDKAQKIVTRRFNTTTTTQLGLEKQVENLRERVEYYDAVVKQLEQYNLEIPERVIDIWPQIQKVIRDHSGTILSTEQRESDQNGVIEERLTIIMQGDYFDLLDVLAGIHSLPIPIVGRGMTIKNLPNPSRQAVEMTLELNIITRRMLESIRDYNQSQGKQVF